MGLCRQMSPYAACLMLAGCFLTIAIAQETTPDSAPANSDIRMEVVTTGSKASLRGLSVVTADVVWASGTGGTVLRTTNGGDAWDVLTVTGADKLDFRDIHAADDSSAVVISAGNPAKVLQTTDAGRTWQLRYEKEHEHVFFDALAFWDRRGIAFSDPIDGRLFIIRTDDGGNTWTEPPLAQRPAALKGEAGFAASGTCLAVHGENHVWIGLGGKVAEGDRTARVVYSRDGGVTWQASHTPLASSDSAGVFSLVFLDERRGVAVGGDYLEPDNDASNVGLTEDGGATWQMAEQRPSGYRSAVAACRRSGRVFVVATGTNGTDISYDRGRTWQAVSKQGYHAVAFAPDGSVGWLTGADGRAARIK